MTTGRNPTRRARGFTLIEALISLAIFSFLGVGAYQLLSSTGALKESGEARYRQLAALQLAVRLLEDDFSQLSPRAVPAASGRVDAALVTDSEYGTIEFTRNGWRNPLELPRGRLQRVAWEVGENATLERRYWRALDERSEESVITRAVATDVEAIDFRFLDAEGKWQRDWPQPAPPAQLGAAAAPEPDPLPVAVEVTLRLKTLGEIRRVIAVR